MPQHAVRAIDYAAMHLWPDNWKRYDLDFGSGWMRNHTDDARRLGKPLVLEEFGKARRTRWLTTDAARKCDRTSTSHACLSPCTRDGKKSVSFYSMRAPGMSAKLLLHVPSYPHCFHASPCRSPLWRRACPGPSCAAANIHVQPAPGRYLACMFSQAGCAERAVRNARVWAAPTRRDRRCSNSWTGTSSYTRWLRTTSTRAARSR